MSAKYCFLITVLIILLAFNISSGEINTALNIGGGYNDNLFNDSLATEDSYSTLGGHISYYPSSSVQITAFGQYSDYKTNNDLSNIYGGGSIDIVPTGENSPISIFLSGDMFYQEYGGLYTLYNQKSFVSEGLIVFKAAPRFHIKSKVSFSTVSYFNSDYGSRNGLALSGGFNLIPLGTNSFNFNASYYRGKYEQIPIELENSSNGRGNRTEDFDRYSITDISIRYSRPIGARTGISVTLDQRNIWHENSFIVTDFDVDNLSPLANLWSGPSGAVFVKHIFPHQYTLVINGRYVEKRFVDAIEYSREEMVTYQQDSRYDANQSFLISLSKAITVGSGNILTPMISVIYSSNSSTYDLYDYTSLSASLSMNIRF
jgi:hypothetical protein